MANPWRVEGDLVLLHVRLTPRASRDSIGAVDLLADGKAVVPVKVRAVPEDGKANEALLRLLSKQLAHPYRQLTLAAGATSRLKTVRIEAADGDMISRLRALTGG